MQLNVAQSFAGLPVLADSDEILRGRRFGFLAIRNTDNEWRRRGSELTNFQSRAAQTIEVLMNQSHRPACFDGCDEAGGTAVFFCNVGRGFQRRNARAFSRLLPGAR